MRAYKIELVVYTDDATDEQVKESFTMLELPSGGVEVAEVVTVKEVTEEYQVKS